MRFTKLFYCASLALFSCAFPSLSCPFLEAATLPNIVLIQADDMGVGDPGCYNPQSKIPTPNIGAEMTAANVSIRFTMSLTNSTVIRNS